MKKSIVVRALLFLAFLLVTGSRAGAQIITLFGISVSNSPTTVLLGNNLTYTIDLTNLSGGVQITTVTDTYPASATFQAATNLLGLTTNNPGQTVFSLGSFSTGTLATMTLVVQPTQRGLFTNVVTVGAFGDTNFVTVTNVTLVTNLTTSLAVILTVPSNAVLAGDYVTYLLQVTNSGANSATGVVLSNTLPAGANFISVSPTNPAPTLTNGALTFNLGTLASKAVDSFNVTIEPTAAGTNTITAGVSSGRSQPSFATNSFVVSPLITNELVAINISAMTYDQQDGLMEQTIELSNISTNPVAAARVIVAGLTNQLYNAVGTNGGNPFVQYGAALATGQSVELVLEYFVPTRQAITVSNSQYTAVPVAAPNLAPPSGTPFNITLITNLPSGNVMIEFQATLGSNYTVIYANNPAMSNAMIAQPSITAPANEVQWIDFGPPETITAPMSTNARFYQILLNH